MKQKNTNAFTLVEILITVVMIAILAIATIMLLNPKNIYNHALDAKKKSDLARFKKALEEYYNDKNCYPPPVKVCYSGIDNPNLYATSCYICGTESGSPKLTPYLDELPCDPNHPTKKYLYVVDNVTCPRNYKIYAKFNNMDDIDSIKVGCAVSGCGPSKGYDYGEASPNVPLDVTKVYYCLTTTNSCDNCGTYEQCSANMNTPTNPNGVCKTIFSDKDTCLRAR